MTGNKFPPRTAPIHSGGNRADYPISSDFINPNYTDFLSGNMKKTGKILITQTMHNGYFTGCFATSHLYNPRPATLWWIRPNHDTFLEFVQKEWEWKNEKSTQIYSLACDEQLGFGIFLMENFGTLQFKQLCIAHQIYKIILMTVTLSLHVLPGVRHFISL